MAEEEKRTRKRRPQERAEITKRKLIETALKEFSERGFDAVTVRDIEVLAGVQRNLVSYHFGSKDELWKAAATDIMTTLDEYRVERMEVVRDLSVRDRIAYTLRSYVRFCAQHPELNRLMIQEGKQDSWRMEWMVDQWHRPAMLGLRALVEEGLDLTDDEFVHWYYLFVSSGAMIFSLAPEAKLLFNAEVGEHELIDRHANMMVEFLMSRSRD